MNIYFVTQISLSCKSDAVDMTTKLEGLNPLNRPCMSVVNPQLSKCDTSKYVLPASKLTADSTPTVYFQLWK